ncbi:hypothetical protein F2Q69_00027606 [Brassica cretica]|uniref:Replication protein A 70 kDa DNA-binding subunit B/D first OB fold domain-containing protein n=2 Tax=Brassica TaxID=3705 RepID=A0A8S9S6V1_BRACR|nr:hypothetical protein F2Q69_00027606 [Brassica cretica]
MEFTTVAGVTPFKSEWVIEVKVLHTWKHYTKLSGETLEIILSDVHGTKIHASRKKTYWDKIAKKVHVGMWRNIENFSVTNPGATYRPTNHQYKLNFIYGTDVTPSTLQNDIMILSLVDFQTIQQGVEDENIFIDVIGEVTDLGGLETVLCSGKERKKIEFSLTDLVGRRIACCLWGKFAESIHANYTAAGEETVICLLRFVKIGIYRDEIQISNSFDASQIFFTPIVETEAFLKRFRVHVRVKDGTGEAYLMLLDWIAVGVIPENAAALLNSSFDEKVPLSMEFTTVAGVRPFKSEWAIEVKVLHTWKHYTKLSGETLEIILSDIHGTKIHASCKKTYWDKIAKKVPVGMWRNIENFSVTNPGATYRPTNHQYKLNFIYGTDVTPSILQNDSMFLSLVDFQTIQQGMLLEKSRIWEVLKPSVLGGRRIACCLWGKFAESIHANCTAAGEETVICVLRFVKIGIYRDEIQISNSFDASQIFFTPIVETEDFLKRDVASNALTLVESEQDKLEREIRRDKWRQYPIRDIAELLQSTECDDKVTKVLPKFRVHVRVKDGTGEAYLMLLDWIAVGVIPENAAALLNGSFDESDSIFGSDQHPPLHLVYLPPGTGEWPGWSNFYISRNV